MVLIFNGIIPLYGIEPMVTVGKLSHEVEKRRKFCFRHGIVHDERSCLINDIYYPARSGDIIYATIWKMKLILQKEENLIPVSIK